MREAELQPSVEHTHPSSETYVKIAVVLTIITVTEVAIYYISALEAVLIPMLVALSVVKFTLVVMFYMHLKFDARLCSWVFLSGLGAAVATLIAMMAIHSSF